MSDSEDDAPPQHARISASIPEVDLFARSQPASEEGPQKPWAVGQLLINFGCAVLGVRGELRVDRRLRDAVLVALLRRALVTVEGIYQLLARGLEEPAAGLLRTLLDIELSISLIHRDPTDNMASRLAAYHYYAYQRHGQDMLSDPTTRKEMLGPATRIPEIVHVAKNYARLLESATFDGIRNEVRSARFWHGFDSVEAAFKSIGKSSDYLIPYDSATWFVHDLNVDHDYIATESDEGLRLKGLAQRDPGRTHVQLAHALMRFHRILEIYVAERGLPATPEFDSLSTATFPDGQVERLGPLAAMTSLLLAEFGSDDDMKGR